MRRVLRLLSRLSAYFKSQAQGDYNEDDDENFSDYANRPYSSKAVWTVRELRAKYGIDRITPLQCDSAPNTDEPG